MPHKPRLRRLLFGALTCFALVGAGVTATLIPGAVATAQAQVSADFQEALAPYGQWVRHPRWGMVWVPDDIPRDWRPYQYGHWVYTEEWGWYWVSDPEEEDWGWVVFHYGRWILDRQIGWAWRPDDEWGPAWVDWRYGGDSVGWAPSPPDELIVTYDDNPTYWVFVSPRYLTAPRLRTHYLSPSRRATAFRNTQIVNRSVGYGRGRAAVNPGISPAFVARVSGAALPTYRVTPRVFERTQGVANAVRVSPQQLQSGGAQRGRRANANRVNAVAVQPTSTTIAPNAAATAPAALGKGERGRLGSHPPRAAEGATPAPATPAAAPAPAAPPQPASPAGRAAPPAGSPPAAAPPAAAPPAGAPPTPPNGRQPEQRRPERSEPPRAAPPSASPPKNGPPSERREPREERPPQAAPTPPAPSVAPAARPAAPAEVKRPAPPAPARAEPPHERRAPPPPPPAAAKPPPPPAAPKPPPPAAVKPPPPPAAAKPPPPAAKPAPEKKPEEPPK